MARVIEDLAGDWRRLDERIEGLSAEIGVLARADSGCERLMSVPGIGPIISSAMVAAIGAGDVFTKGRDFAAWVWLPLLRKHSRSALGHNTLKARTPIAPCQHDLIGTNEQITNDLTRLMIADIGNPRGADHNQTP
jgi:transposase